MRTHLLKKIVLAILFSIVSVFASRMYKELREAVYQFEIKGNFMDAQDQLSRISLEGDEEDRSNAFFLLGKIQEVTENPQNAAFYYRQALINPQSSEHAYFLASRIAALDSSPERIVLSRTRFPVSIRKTFENSSPSILLANNQLYTLHEEKLVAVPTSIPSESKIFAISSQGIWFSSLAENTLQFQPKNTKQAIHIFTFDSKILDVLPVSNQSAMVTTEKNFAYVFNEGIRFSIENRYRGCTPVGIYEAQNELVLNCQDNALHLIDAETGSEMQTLSLMDPIQHTLLTEDGIYVASANSIRLYRPQNALSFQWESKCNPIESMTFFGNRIAVLETGGNLKLLDPHTGNETNSTQIDGEILFETAQGALGIFSQEGALTVVNEELQPLWEYHFGKPLSAKPFKNQGRIYLPFDNQEIITITALHYGKKPILSQQFASLAFSEMHNGDWTNAKAHIDSAIALEPGNPTVNYLQAVYLEQIGADENTRANAWANTVRYSFGNAKDSPKILDHFAKIIGAHYVHFLPLSPRTPYPNLFSAGHNLYTVDPAAQQLFAIDPATGTIRWKKDLGFLETSPVFANNSSSLALASGFRIQILDLQHNGKMRYSDLPGKPFQIQFWDNSIFVSTWNGYFVKLLAPNYSIAWARKLFNLPFHFDISTSSIAVSSLEGSFGFVNAATGQNIDEMLEIGANVSSMELSDTLAAIASEQNEIYVFAPHQKKPTHTIQTDSPILSLHWAIVGNTPYLLTMTASQKIHLYGLTSKTPLWTYAGQGSVYSSPVINGNSLYIDQKTHIAKISLAKGILEKSFSTPGGAGTPFILDNTLFCPSPKRLLYAFPLK